MDSALLFAKLMDDSSLKEKVENLSRVILSNSVITNDESSLPMTSVDTHQMEEAIRQAARKLELFKQRVTKSKITSSTDCGTDKPRTWTLAKEWNPCPISMLPSTSGSSTWTLAKEWNPCPIGMLPRIAGSSGYLPSLDPIDNRKDIQELDRKETQNPSKHGVKRDATLGRNETWKPSKHCAKRDATLDITLLDESTAKKKRETEQVSELDHDVLSPIKAKGSLLIDGVWKSVTEEEFRAIKSYVRILV